ncbi:MAG: IS3 family transposase [Pseudomonadota bacterium]
MTKLGFSERRACRIVGLARSVQQYQPMPKDDAAAIKRMKALASENRRYGYLRLHAMLRREGLVVNHKRAYRLSTGHGLQVRTKKRRMLPRRDRVSPQVPEGPIQRWSLDFVSDQLADCRRFRILCVLDDFSRFCPGQIVDVSIPGARVARFLDDLALRIGLPEEIILDNGPEGTSKAMFDWSERRAVRLRFIEPGKPVRDAHSWKASTASSAMSECLNLHWFQSLRHAREEIGRWRNHYDTKRLHSALGYMSSTEFLMKTTAPALETLAVSTLPLNTETQPKIPDQTRPNQGERSMPSTSPTLRVRPFADAKRRIPILTVSTSARIRFRPRDTSQAATAFVEHRQTLWPLRFRILRKNALNLAPARRVHFFDRHWRQGAKCFVCLPAF